MSQVGESVRRLGLAAVMVALIVLGMDWFVREDQRARETREERAHERAYEVVYDEMLDALTDSLSADTLVMPLRPRTKDDSTRAEEVTSRLMQRFQDAPEILEWLKLSKGER